MTTLQERQLEFCSYFLPYLPMRSAAAIGGNATQENQCLPVTQGPKDHGSDGALQWRAERLDGPDGLKTWSAAHGLQWDTLETQALFTMHELGLLQYDRLRADLNQGVKSLETLTLDFCDAFERPSTAGREPDKRIGYAGDCLKLLKDVHPVPLPVPGAQMPPIDPAIATQLAQFLAPFFESLVSGMIKGMLSHLLPMSGPLDAAAIEKIVLDAVTKSMKEPAK